MFEKQKPWNGKCSNGKLSQRRGSPQPGVDTNVATARTSACATNGHNLYPKVCGAAAVVGYFENRRYTRLTNAFSRKVENHTAAVALGYFAYNFIKIHRTLRVTAAMAAGLTDRLWEVSDLVALLEASERKLERVA